MICDRVREKGKTLVALFRIQVLILKKIIRRESNRVEVLNCADKYIAIAPCFAIKSGHLGMPECLAPLQPSDCNLHIAVQAVHDPQFWRRWLAETYAILAL